MVRVIPQEEDVSKTNTDTHINEIKSLFCMSWWSHLKERDFTMTDVSCSGRVFDRHFPIVFDPALTAQNVMNAWSDFTPLITIPKTENEWMSKRETERYWEVVEKVGWNNGSDWESEQFRIKWNHPGSSKWVTPIGTISMDFPQNLFFHRTSNGHTENGH